MNESLDLYRRTFLGEGSLEQPIEKIMNQFMAGNQKILVNLKTLPNHKKCGVAATAIVCVLNDSESVFHLDYLCVNSEYRGNGIGSVFMTQFVIPHLNNHYGKHLTLECEERLMRWYNKLGAKTLSGVYSSRLGDLPAEYHLMCFLSSSSSSLSENELTASQAQQVLFEVRRRFHGMSDYELIEKVIKNVNENEQEDMMMQASGASATGEKSPSSPSLMNEEEEVVTMVYRWIKDTCI